MKRSAITAMLALAGAGAIAVGVFCVRVFNASEAACESTCCGNLGPLSYNWISYHHDNGAFLTERVPDRDGKMISWKETLNTPMSHGECSFGSGGAGHFALVTGRGTIGNGPAQLGLESITDGWENTLAVVELPGSGESEERWVIEIDDLDRHLDKDGNLSALGIHPSGRGLMFIDGGIYRQLKPFSKDQVRALMTVAGGESLTRDELVKSGHLRHRFYGEDSD